MLTKGSIQPVLGSQTGHSAEVGSIGILSTVGQAVAYQLGIRPTADYKPATRPRITRFQTLAAANRTDEDGLRELAARAGEAADSAPSDPDFPGLAPPAVVPEVQGCDDALADLLRTVCNYGKTPQSQGLQCC